MKDFNHRNRKLFAGTHLIGVLILAAGLFAISTPWIYANQVPWNKAILIGGIASTLGIVISSLHSGTLINFSAKKVKCYTSLLGIKMGEWQPLQEINTVTAQETNYHGSRMPNGISPTLSWQISAHQVALRDASGQSVMKFNYSSKEKAHQVGKELSGALHATFEVIT